MTILNEKNLLVTAFASKDETRPHLNCVAVEPDGTTIAVNGHAMAVVTPQREVGEDELPNMTKPIRAAETQILVPLRDAIDMRAELKRQRKATMPCQQVLARVASDNGAARFVRPDPNGHREFVVHPADEKFPPYKEVIPNTDEYIEIAIDVKYLRLLADTVRDFRDDKAGQQAKGVKLLIPKDPLDPMVATSHNSDQELTVVIMPLRD